MIINGVTIFRELGKDQVSYIVWILILVYSSINIGILKWQYHYYISQNIVQTRKS